MKATFSGGDGGNDAPEATADTLEDEAPVEKGGKSGGKGAKGDRMKDLVVNVFGVDRHFGAFPTRLHSDFRHLLEFLRRGKQPRLSRERVSALEEVMAKNEPPAPITIGELRQQVEAWRSEHRASWDADKYYDKERAQGYTEHNRGSQHDLTCRSLELSSVRTRGQRTANDPKEKLLVIDLGCGTGLSTGVPTQLPGLAVIGVDLSSEMLRADSWKEVADLKSPMAGERVRCDLAQPLPFRAGTFDLAYSVAAVHYLAQGSVTHTAEQRLDSFLTSLKRTLVPSHRPCTLQAFFTKEPIAVKLFKEACARTGWAICELIIDRPHGGSGADRDFLYLVAQAPPGSTLGPLPRCAVYSQTGAVCALAVKEWAEKHGVPPPQLDDVHLDWLWREHLRYAKRLVRLKARVSNANAQLDHASPPSSFETALAVRLEEILKDEASDSAEFRARLLAELHTSEAASHIAKE